MSHTDCWPWTTECMIATFNNVLCYPTSFFSKKDIFGFEAFVQGWHHSRNRPDEKSFFNFFVKNILKKFNRLGEYWPHLLIDEASKLIGKDEEVWGMSPEAAAMVLFKREWDEFLQTCPPDLLPYESQPKPSRPYRSIDDE